MMKKPTVLIPALVVVLLVIAWASGWLGAITQPAAIQGAVARAGIWGPFIFVVLAQGLFVAFMLAPGVWAAAGLWPLPLAFLYSFVASMLASVLTYVIARRLGRDWAQGRVPPSIQRWEDRLRARPFLTIIALRIFLWANPFVDLFAAVAGIPVRTYLLATTIGMIIPTAFQIFLGVSGKTMAGHLPWWSWILAAAVALAVVLSVRKLRARQPAPTS